MKILQFPLAKLFACYVVGLLLAYQGVFSLPTALLLFSSSLVILSIGFVLKKRIHCPAVLIDGVLLFASLALGAFVLLLHTERYQKDHYTQYPNLLGKPVLVRAIIQEKLRKSATNDRYIAAIFQLHHQEVNGKILLSIENDSTTEIAIGTKIQLNGSLLPNPSPKNPYQFNYASYLNQKQIYAQLFAHPEEIQYQKEPQKNLWYYTSALRNTIAKNLKQSGINDQNLAIVMALLLGQQQDIDANTIKDYQYAGAVHILSVSGLHIGCIVLFLNFILSPIPNTPRGRFLKLMVSLLSLATFGVLAGLAPSVLRSVTMFAFVAIGNYWYKNSNIYHTVIVSALLILLCQPYLIFDVGFQLSYAALFFIVWLQPLLVSVFLVKNKVALFFWNILTVSFAAQIGTLPLSLYYFHQFPGLFFVTNLFILPLLSVIMILGVIVMIIAIFSKVPMLLLSPLDWGIQVMNTIIHWVASVEQMVFENISFSIGLLIGFYLLIISFFVWVQNPKFHNSLAVLLAIVWLQILYITIKIQQQNDNEWVVLHTPKATTICERTRDKIKVYTNEKLTKNSYPYTTLQNYATGVFSEVQTIIPTRNTYAFNGQKILLVDSTSILPSAPNCDILVLSKGPKINLDRALVHYQPKMVIADASNYRKLIERWKTSCQKQHIPFHATAEKGYFVIKSSSTQ